MVVDVVVRILQDEFFAAEGGLSVVLLQDVELAQLHPGLGIVHEVFEVLDELGDDGPTRCVATASLEFRILEFMALLTFSGTQGKFL